MVFASANQMKGNVKRGSQSAKVSRLRGAGVGPLMAAET
jgi:hypothetical protein